MPRLHREIFDVLLTRIVAGRYQPGTLLPKEQAIVEEFDVSRGIGREALRALEERRLVIVKHGRGATVQPPDEWNVVDAAVAGEFAQGRRRREFLDEIAECRRTLWVEAAGLAAERATARERAAIAAAGEQLAAADDPAAAASELWRLVVMAARNRPIGAVLRSLADIEPPAFDDEALDACAGMAAAIGAARAPEARTAAAGVS